MALWTALAAGILPQLASVVGVAVDSLRGGPLANAVVVVSDGAGRQSMTDAAGRFRIDSIPPGTHRVALFHALLDSLGFSITSPPMSFSGGDTVRLTIATPSAVTLIQRVCSQDTAIENLQPTAIVGTVLGDAQNATVTLEWKQVDASKRQGVVQRMMTRQVATTADGRFRVCSPPGVTQARIRAVRGDATTSWVSVELSRGGVLLPTLHLAEPSKAGRAIGQVVGPNHEKVPGATVELDEGMADTRTTTDGNGKFVLASLPEGTQTLNVRAAGYSPTTVVVELVAATPWQGVVQLGPAPPVLSTVHILAQRLAPAYDAVGFNERRRRGVGTFLDIEDIDRKHPLTASDIFETVPGIYVDHSFHPPIIMGSRGHSSVMGSSGVCVNLYVDGHRVYIEAPADTNNVGRAESAFLPLYLERYVDVDEIAAVEVYNPEELPSVFERVGDACQTIVIWTKGALAERH